MVGFEGAFDEFSVEMGDFDVSKRDDYHNCLWQCSEGGSIDQLPVIHNGKILFGSFNRKFYALDLRTHEPVWIFEAHDRIGLSSPVLYKDSVIFGSYDRNVYRLDTETGNLIWKFETQGEIASSVVTHEGLCYFSSRDQNLYAVRCDDGGLVWKFHTYKPNVSVPTIHGERMFFGSSDRNLYCLERKTGNLIWKFEAEEELVVIRPLLIVNDCIYLGTMGTMIYSISINDGRLVWKKKFGDYGMTRGGAYLKGMIVQPTQGGFLYAFTPDGRVLWKVTRNETFTSVITDGERIYTSSEDEYFYCFDSDGKLVWRFKMEGPVWQPALVHEGVVYAGSNDCFLYALDARSGELLWKFRSPGSPITHPPIRSYFEVSVKIREEEIGSGSDKKYEVKLSDDEDDGTSSYKSRITYQISTQYGAKGKYQIDSHEEEF